MRNSPTGILECHARAAQNSDDVKQSPISASHKKIWAHRKTSAKTMIYSIVLAQQKTYLVYALAGALKLLQKNSERCSAEFAMV